VTINFPKGIKPSKCETISQTHFIDTPHGKIKEVVRFPRGAWFGFKPELIRDERLMQRIRALKYTDFDCDMEWCNEHMCHVVTCEQDHKA
jgi:hypothetical protein